MKTLLFWCLIALFTGLPLYFLYWNLFRPVLIQRLKYRLFKVRDELRLFLISGGVGDKESVYPLIERFCNKALSQLEGVDLAVLFSAKVNKQAALEIERDLNVIFSAGPEVRRFFIQIVVIVMGAASANSPGALILLAPLFIFAVTALWFNRVKLWFVRLIKNAMANLFLRPASC